MPLFEQSISTFKSEVFDSATKFEGMKKGVPKVTVDLLQTPVREKRVEMLRKSIGNSSTLKLRNTQQGEFRDKYYKIKPKLMEDFFVIGADLAKKPAVNTKEIYLPSQVMYMFSDNRECQRRKVVKDFCFPNPADSQIRMEKLEKESDIHQILYG